MEGSWKRNTSTLLEEAVQWQKTKEGKRTETTSRKTLLMLISNKTEV